MSLDPLLLELGWPLQGFLRVLPLNFGTSTLPGQAAWFLWLFAPLLLSAFGFWEAILQPALLGGRRAQPSLI